MQSNKRWSDKSNSLGWLLMGQDTMRAEWMVHTHVYLGRGCEDRWRVSDPDQKKKSKEIFPSKVELKVLTQQVSFLLHPRAFLVIWNCVDNTLVSRPISDSLPIKENEADKYNGNNCRQHLLKQVNMYCLGLSASADKCQDIVRRRKETRQEKREGTGRGDRLFQISVRPQPIPIQKTIQNKQNQEILL